MKHDGTPDQVCSMQGEPEAPAGLDAAAAPEASLPNEAASGDYASLAQIRERLADQAALVLVRYQHSMFHGSQLVEHVKPGA